MQAAKTIKTQNKPPGPGRGRRRKSNAGGEDVEMGEGGEDGEDDEDDDGPGHGEDDPIMLGEEGSDDSDGVP